MHTQGSLMPAEVLT